MKTLGLWNVLDQSLHTFFVRYWKFNLYVFIANKNILYGLLGVWCQSGLSSFTLTLETSSKVIIKWNFSFLCIILFLRILLRTHNQKYMLFFHWMHVWSNRTKCNLVGLFCEYNMQFISEALLWSWYFLVTF